MTSADRSRVHHVLLDEQEELAIQRILGRNPKRNVEKAMKERAVLQRKARDAGWAIMSLVELAEFLWRLAGGNR